LVRPHFNCKLGKQRLCRWPRGVHRAMLAEPMCSSTHPQSIKYDLGRR